MYEHSFVDFAVDERLKKNIITKIISLTRFKTSYSPYSKRARCGGIANTGTGKTAACDTAY